MKCIWLQRLLRIEPPVNRDTYWEQQWKEMKERHAREIFARVSAAGCLVTEDSTVDGIRYGDLQSKEVTPTKSK